MADATVDASITANAGRNMLTNLGQMASVMNSINQNRLFQGRQAAGAALQQSIDPDTGQVDYAHFNALIRANPQIAPFAQEALQQGLASQGQGISNTTAQQGLANAYSAALRNDFVAAHAAGEDPVQAVLRGVAAGRYPAGFAASALGGLPLSNGKTLGDFARESAVAGGTEAGMEATFGKPETVDVGGRLVTRDVNRVTNEAQPMTGPAATLDKTLTPESKATRVPIVQGGVPKTVPLSALATDTGEPKPGVADSTGAVQASLTPAQQAAGATTGTAMAGLGSQIVQRAGQVPSNKALLGNMEGLLDNFTPGPQSPFWKSVNQLATQYHLAPPGSPPQTKAQAQEEFGKLAFQLAQGQFQALGGTGTDSKLESTMHTSPSELLTRYGNKGIIHLLKGNEDAMQAQADAWQKWQSAGNGPETYGKFQSQWNSIYDPRVFQSQYMDPGERQTMLKGMTAAEQAKFKADYKRAVQLGWVK